MKCKNLECVSCEFWQIHSHVTLFKRSRIFITPKRFCMPLPTQFLSLTLVKNNSLFQFFHHKFIITESCALVQGFFYTACFWDSFILFENHSYCCVSVIYFCGCCHVVAIVWMPQFIYQFLCWWINFHLSVPWQSSDKAFVYIKVILVIITVVNGSSVNVEILSELNKYFY